MKVEQTKEEVIFTFPRFAKRYNPYGTDEENDKGEFGFYPTLTGLIIRHRKGGHWDEMGFAGTIDMDYKGKSDQVGDFVVTWHGDEESFREKCKELGMGIYEFET